MYRVAICDDEVFAGALIESIVIKYSKKCSFSIDIDVFHSGKELYNSILEGASYNILFLDIEMHQINGVEMGKMIREEFDDQNMHIVYVSGKQDYAMELFQVRPLDFIIKPVLENVIEAVLDKAMSLDNKRNVYFEYDVERIRYKVMLSDILYFECNNKRIKLVRKDTTHEFYGKLSNMMDSLKNDYLINIHQSIMVNYQHVVECHYDRVVMSNGEVLPISLPYRKSIRNIIFSRRKKKERQQG